MDGFTRLGIGLTAVGGAAALIGVWSTPYRVMVMAALAIGLGIQLIGALLVRSERQPIGSAVLALGALASLPFGAVTLVGASRGYAKHRLGTLLGRKEPIRPQRPRAWTLASCVFAVASGICLIGALVYPHLGTMEAISQPMVSVAGALLAILCGLEAVLLWIRHDDGLRLGIVLSIVMAAVAVVVGFGYHSYLAVSLLALPLYAFYLVWTGRKRWSGLSREGAGIEGRGRRRATA